jgi:hypothetical protein
MHLMKELAVPEDFVGRAYLLALEGRSPTEIGEILNAPASRVVEWLGQATERARDVPRQSLGEPQGEPRADERAAIARRALERQQIVTVAVGGDLLGDADIGVGIPDMIAHEMSDVVDGFVSELRRLPRVGEAIREDREFIAVYGQGIDLHSFTTWAGKWWRDQLVEMSKATDE